ncbi:hypothetical protein EV193_101801 [Herbihabitans rhizosphaerae]|uniref:PE family protein n=1 Tax=Herbihabitans rhizosphaerae TaxID=1872711 RepID=A0A4Q7L7P5_9PSEU|nr:hypothetical protein [Herbihabitans rhizosphaerae]RZS44920.1 hypothetical protein EV193_101801 [Herbihabitans rhizosphaerae]
MLPADMGGSLSNAKMLADGAQGLHAAAAKGDIEVEPTGGQALIRAIDKLQGFINEQEGNAVNRQQEPPLGDSNGARVIKPFVASVASDPGQGFYPMLKHLRTQLNTYKDAITMAMNNYKATDLRQASGMNRINR